MLRVNATGGVRRPDELSNEQLAVFAEKHRLVMLQVEHGLSAAAALQEVGLEMTPRAARRLRRKFEQDGPGALVDGRCARQPECTVMLPEVKKLVLKLQAARPAAGPAAIAQKVRSRCRASGLPEPSNSSVQTYLASLTEAERLFLEGDLETWDKQARPVVRVERATHSNERWGIDHTTLDYVVRVPYGNRYIPKRVHMTGTLDVFSRACPGFRISTAYPDTWSIGLAVRQAVLPKDRPGWSNKGLPETVQHDQGPDFMSHQSQIWFAGLNVMVDPSAPYYPNDNGKVERFFRTLDGFLRTLPGHTAAIGVSPGAWKKHLDRLLTLHQLREEIERFIVEIYHERVHDETGERPRERWERHMSIPRIPSRDDLNMLLLKSDKIRVVRNTGVDFMKKRGGGRYWAPPLGPLFKREVRIAFNPEDLESVLVYDATTGRFICEAFVMGRKDSRYDVGDVKRERRSFRRGMKARIEEYREEIHREDRRKAREEDARRLAEEMEDDPAMPDAPDVDEDVEELLRELEREDRSEPKEGHDD